MFNYFTVFPSPSLQSFVSRYAVFEGKLPQGFVWNYGLIPNIKEWIFFNLSEPQTFIVETKKLILNDCLITGQFSKPFQAELSGSVKLIGIEVNVPGLCQLFSVPIHLLSDNALRLEDLIGKDAKYLHDALLEKRTIEEAIFVIETFFVKWINFKLKPVNSNVLYAIELIKNSKGTKTVTQLVKETGKSEKTLQRLFINQVGLTPKLYSRVYKFNEVIWYFNNHKSFSTDIIQELGYFDQAHFIHDFKSFSGENPSTYFKRHPGINEFFSKW